MEEYEEDRELEEMKNRRKKLENELKEQHHKERMDSIIGVLGKRIKLTKEQRKELEESIRKDFLESPQLGKDLLVFMQSLSLDNRKVHEKVIDTHKDTIDKLFVRLDKENLSEKEIELIYGEIRELSEKIEKARKSWKDWVDKAGVGLLAIIATLIGGYAKSRLDSKYSAGDDPDIIEGEYSETDDERT
ncbi:hypothetical protein [Halobacillus mangrovi]|uniref:hypothetical protein n=1 Tax=Halobacillus mangrovi TaxID=402384 RepID=UPI003D97DA04